MKCKEFKIPDNLLKTLNVSADEFISSMRREYAKILFKERKLGLQQSAAFCGVDFCEFMSILAADIPVIEYDMEYLEQEIATVKAMGEMDKINKK